MFMGVTHYPTVQFLGAGSYYQNDPVSSLLYGRQKVERAVFFEGSPDPEILKVGGRVGGEGRDGWCFFPLFCGVAWLG